MNKRIITLIVTLLLVCSFFSACANTDELETLVLLHIDSSESYTPESYTTYENALSIATEICSKQFVSQSDVDLAASDLRSAIADLTKRADKTKLIDEKEKALEINQGDYIPVSCVALNDAITNAETIINDLNASVDDVNDAINAVQLATSGLIACPDKTLLVEKCDYADQIDLALYLKASQEFFNAATDDAKMVLDNENASQKDVDNVVAGLEDAISKLELKPDKTALSTLIDDAKTVEEKVYTTASYNSFSQLIPDAQKVLENDEATQAEVDSAIETLNNARNGLIKSTKCIWSISTYLCRTETNHVGNDWSSGVFYNGEQVGSCFQVTAREGSSITITGKAVENDKVPDVGSGSVYIGLYDGNESETTFYVRENRGRYSGNCAVWVLEVSCELIERV